jgi:excisionase family DNA binding protein
LPKNEREKFFALLAEKAFPSEENFTHDEVFGHLTDAEFTAAEAADYLQVSIATFRRYVRDGKIKATSEVGTSHLYALA